jgi:hypothetical protein
VSVYPWSNCRSFNAKVFWLKHEKTGKPAPIDVTPSNAGNIEIDLAKRIYRNVGKGPGRHTNHFSTCPSADVWKRHGGSGMRGPRNPLGRE